MRTFSKYYHFETLVVRLFWYDEDGSTRALASIEASKEAEPSEKPIGQRLGGILRGTLNKATEQQRNDLLTVDELAAAKTALVELARALGLEKRT